MKKKINANLLKAMKLAVIAIGAYMTIKFWGAALPPVLSGIAFVLIGATLWFTE